MAELTKSSYICRYMRRCNGGCKKHEGRTVAKVNLTRPKVDGFKCPAGKAQAFLWDTAQPGLGLRVTPAGKPAYIFQSLFEGRTVRLTIGSPDAWTIPDAQARAR